MKLLMLSAVTLILCSANKNPYVNPATQNTSDTSFTLRYIFIGFGSNRWKMQPGFRISGSNFTYTSEQVWAMPGEHRQIDTIGIGS